MFCSALFKSLPHFTTITSGRFSRRWWMDNQYHCMGLWLMKPYKDYKINFFKEANTVIISKTAIKQVSFFNWEHFYWRNHLTFTCTMKPFKRLPHLHLNGFCMTALSVLAICIFLRILDSYDDHNIVCFVIYSQWYCCFEKLPNIGKI